MVNKLQEKSPLTLDEVKGRDGKPIWCVSLEEEYNAWHIVIKNEYMNRESDIPFIDVKYEILAPLGNEFNHYYNISDYEKKWIAYDCEYVKSKI